MCDIDDGERPKLFDIMLPVSRKEHVCCECSGVILKGEKYQRSSGLWDTFQTFKTCLFCAGVRDDYFYTSDQCIPFEKLWECVGYDGGY